MESKTSGEARPAWSQRLRTAPSQECKLRLAWQELEYGNHPYYFTLVPFKERPVPFHTEEKPQGSESVTLGNERDDS